MSFRFEKKFLLQKTDYFFIKNNFLNKTCDFLFPPRNINSLYFDTKELNNYYDSEEGILPRIKLRIRNYDNISKYYKEIKVSSFEGRYKTSNDYPFINFKSKYLYLFYKGKNYFPYVYTNYTREYLTYLNYRITIDKDIMYINYKNNKVFYDNNIIVEIKSKDHIDFSHHFFNLFKFSDTRYSKYCNAIKNVSSLV